MALYRSPSQTQNEFEKVFSQTQNELEKVSDNLELYLGTLSQKIPFLIVAIGDFNAKAKNCYFNDSATSQGNVLENLTSQFGLQGIIKEPTNFLDNSSPCTDLIFTSQSKLITELGVHLSLHPNRHNQVVYAKFNLKIYYPPQYF